MVNKTTLSLWFVVHPIVSVFTTCLQTLRHFKSCDDAKSIIWTLPNLSRSTFRWVPQNTIEGKRLSSVNTLRPAARHENKNILKVGGENNSNSSVDFSICPTFGCGFLNRSGTFCSTVASPHEPFCFWDSSACCSPLKDSPRWRQRDWDVCRYIGGLLRKNKNGKCN